MNKNLIMTVFMVITGCNGQPITYDSTSTESSTQSVVASSIASATPTVMKQQRYLYALSAGGVKTIPIDSDTGELIQVETGNWWVKPADGLGNFYTMAMNPNGKMIYVLLRNTSLQSKIYQYSISDVAYSTYGTERPLTELSAKAATNVIPGLLSWGNNGNLFIQNFNFSPNKVDTYTINATTFLLSLPSTLGTQTTVSATYGLNFARVTEVGFDDHTYMIDSQSNRIIHYKNGVIQSSFDISTQGAITDLAIQ